MKKCDYLVIGSGIAGLSFAIKIAQRFPQRKVIIITKTVEEECNTKYAQGGIAVVIDKIEDSFEKHIQDTLICGDGLCDSDVVKMVVSQGPERLQELMNWGAQFDLTANGTLDLGKEGGHSNNRVVHHKDQTGYEIEKAIVAEAHRQPNIEFYEYHFALDLVTKDNCCLGAKVLNELTNEIITIQSTYTLLATGGIGQVYGHTTNPTVATGDGIAMAKRANAIIADMEFIQFHPTALYHKDVNPTFLISEAVRGFGAVLRTKDGRRFMTEYDDRADLASRDIVSQSIEQELKKSGDECVYLDCTQLDIKAFKNHFPMIYDRCKALSIPVETQWIPVIPAQHYLCGGIVVNTNGQTSVENLFACGECSRTGLHGANRLASNSLLEAIVYSNNIYTYLSQKKKINPKTAVVNHHEFLPKPGTMNQKYLASIRDHLQKIMQQNAGIIRNDVDLLDSQMELTYWELELQLLEENFALNKAFCELKNMITVGLLIVDHSLKRTENRGGFVKNKKTTTLPL
ncbi:L-aspartate oxidase [Flavobacterium sp. XGLA_31]|uniref:L-aspartate oxidase n=1 Tax=Flavobacterium sp. XGLA_31 TaxID=3447666 RepID=UPI003F325B09